MDKQQAQSSLTKYQFRILGFISILTLSIGTIFYHIVEDLNWVDSVYFSTITLTTIGYGDITPKTDIGKLFTVFYVIIGISIIGAFINAILRRGATRNDKKHN
ncbi:two pore domain potassium channel family protein [Candidatus Saccharibacteria bacterium]|jgi:voltage-gated potassium channel|nr:two pore domain potassium channel family protein [Candidatus Saccharibacteria bacterium]